MSDFFFRRWLRAAIYRFSPHLDHETERPLLRAETEPPLPRPGLRGAGLQVVGMAVKPKG